MSTPDSTPTPQVPIINAAPNTRLEMLAQEYQRRKAASDREAKAVEELKGSLKAELSRMFPESPTVILTGATFRPVKMERKPWRQFREKDFKGAYPDLAEEWTEDTTRTYLTMM